MATNTSDPHPDDVRARAEAEFWVADFLDKVREEGEGKVAGSGYVIVEDRRTEPIELDFRDVETKRESCKQLVEIAFKRKAIGILTVNEAWYASGKKEDPPKGPVSKNPNRKSCVIASIIGPNVPSSAYIVPFSFTFDGELLIEDPKWMDGVENNLVQPWWLGDFEYDPDEDDL